jgi:hypothetical protein
MGHPVRTARMQERVSQQLLALDLGPLLLLLLCTCSTSSAHQGSTEFLFRCVASCIQSRTSLEMSVSLQRPRWLSRLCKSWPPWRARTPSAFPALGVCQPRTQLPDCTWHGKSNGLLFVGCITALYTCVGFVGQPPSPFLATSTGLTGSSRPFASSKVGWQVC